MPPLAPSLAMAAGGSAATLPDAHPAYPQAPLHGLGTEGLDALFPHDPEARMAAGRAAPPPPALETPTVPGAGATGYPNNPATLPPRRPASFSGPRPTIPLKALNSQPLSTDPPASDMLPAAAAEGAANAATLPGAGVEDLPTIEMPPVEPAVAPGRRDVDAARYRAAPAAAPPRRQTRPDAPRRTQRANALPARDRSWTRAVAVLAALAALGIVWIGAHAAASLLARQPTRVAAGPTALPTTPPTAVPTAGPTQVPTPAATATPSPQQIADSEAAAAFRAITVFTGQDGGCATTTQAFTTVQAISVNLCVAQSAHSGLVSIQLRQDGSVLTTMAQGVSILPGYWYSWTTHSRPAGSYDMLVTYNNGTAADITFTVN